MTLEGTAICTSLDNSTKLITAIQKLESRLSARCSMNYEPYDITFTDYTT